MARAEAQTHGCVAAEQGSLVVVATAAVVVTPAVVVTVVTAAVVVTVVVTPAVVVTVVVVCQTACAPEAPPIVASNNNKRGVREQQILFDLRCAVPLAVWQSPLDPMLMPQPDPGALLAGPVHSLHNMQEAGAESS